MIIPPLLGVAFFYLNINFHEHFVNFHKYYLPLSLPSRKTERGSLEKATFLKKGVIEIIFCW